MKCILHSQLVFIGQSILVGLLTCKTSASTPLESMRVLTVFVRVGSQTKYESINSIFKSRFSDQINSICKSRFSDQINSICKSRFSDQI